MLAASGAWGSAAALSEKLLGNSHPVDVLLTLRWYRIVALIKARDVPKAERELAMLGDLNSQGWHYERYPGIYPNRAGSMVHSSLLVLQALLPSYKGNHDDALAQLYALVANGDRDPVAEHAQAILAIVNVLCAVHDYSNAVGHVEQLIAAVQRGGEDSAPQVPHANTAGKPSSPDLPQLLSLLGRLHLQLGNLDAAADAFDRLECSIPSAENSAQVRINRGLLAVALSRFESALAEFEAALSIDPKSTIAANNAAVCQLYVCKLEKAVATLEGQIKVDPQQSMHPAVISNLTNLNQMTSHTVVGGSQKPSLELLIQACAGDDFDMNVLNLGQM